MAAVVDIRTAARVTGTDRPRLVLIESPVNMGRVYLKRRLMVGVFLVVGLLALGLIVNGAIRSSTNPTLVVETHLVMPDETLWSISKDARPDHDPRSTIMLVAELNSIDGSTFDPWAPLAVGQRIRVPVDR